MPKREVTAPIRFLRRAFLRIERPDVNYLRFQGKQYKEVSPRTQPPPHLPDGPSHQLSVNYYHARDARRLVDQPVNIYQAGQNLLPGITKKALPTGGGEAYEESAYRILPGKQLHPEITEEHEQLYIHDIPETHYAHRRQLDHFLIGTTVFCVVFCIGVYLQNVGFRSPYDINKRH